MSDLEKNWIVPQSYEEFDLICQFLQRIKIRHLKQNMVIVLR